MKITVWIRPDRDDPTGRGISYRVDPQYESRDTPAIQHFGRELLTALKGCGQSASPNEKAQTP